ncbi:MAG: Gfo/Idh/MocA family oxidoreductase [Cyanobacteria bacterium REEB67]|nr:Gfo/Idh/MocA family oxidoreductase [Cyanobacteria bacterium REEB67]
MAAPSLLSAGEALAQSGDKSNLSAVGLPKTKEGGVDFGLDKLAADSERQTAGVPDLWPPDKRVKFALVGLGHLTLEEILPAFAQSKKAKLTGLVSGSPDKARAVAEQYGIKAANIYDYKNYDAIKDNPDIDVVYIVLPNSMHCEFTVRAAAADKHVLCEKPMATNVADCQKMIDSCKAASKKLMIAYRIQYEPNNRLIQKLVRDQTFGKVKIIEASNGQNQGDVNQWRHKRALAGGGAMPDIGIYCLNTIRSMLGEEPSEVFATTYSTPGDPRFSEVEESIVFQLRFPGGVIAHCSSGYGYHELRQYRFMAEKAWFGMEPAFAYSGLQMQLSLPQGSREIFAVPKIDAVNQFVLELDHMAECIAYDKKPLTPGEEGLQDQKIIEALYASASEHKPVALLPVAGLDSTRGDALPPLAPLKL